MHLIWEFSVISSRGGDSCISNTGIVVRPWIAWMSLFLNPLRNAFPRTALPVRPNEQGMGKYHVLTEVDGFPWFLYPMCFFLMVFAGFVNGFCRILMVLFVFLPDAVDS